MSVAMRKARAGDSNPRNLIMQLCREQIADLDAQKVLAIDAMIVARRVAAKLDPKKKTPAEMYFAALEGIAQIARPELRHAHEPPEPGDTKQLDAFSRTLQDRYSIKRPAKWEGYQYVLRDEITKEEVRKQVIPMLQAYRDAYDKHIDLVYAWNEAR